MSSEALANAAYITGLLTLAGGILWAGHRFGRPSEEERVAEARRRVGMTVWDDDAQQWVDLPEGVAAGPSQYTPADVAALDQLVLAWQEPAFDPATDPQWADARARLLADLNDQQGEL